MVSGMTMTRKVLTAAYVHASQRPGDIAFRVLKDGAWTVLSFADVVAGIEDWARRLIGLGLPRGSVVFFVLKHRHEAYVAFLGAMRAGLVPSFLPYPTPKQDAAQYWQTHDILLARVRPSAIISYGANVGILAGMTEGACGHVLDLDGFAAQPVPDVALPALDEVEGDNHIALLQHSSGTTGLKKGVILRHEQIRSQIADFSAAGDIDADCVFITWLPIYHDMGLIACFLMPFVRGGSIVAIDPFDWLARPDMFLDLIAEHRGTHCFLPNFAFSHLARTRDRRRTYDVSSMRAFINASEPPKEETMRRFREVFGPAGLRDGALQVAYGMAETVLGVSQTPMSADASVVHVDLPAFTAARRIRRVEPGSPRSTSFVSCGRIFPNIEARIDAAPGEDIGEIQVRGAYVFSGYYLNDAATTEAFDDGWFRTGDQGFMLDGEVYVCGRIKEMLIVHGRNYYATDLEGIVSDIPGVKPGRAVAFGVQEPGAPSEEAILLAETELVDPAAIAELRQTIRKVVFDRVELSLRHIEILPVGHLLKTTSGKLSRKDNRELYLSLRQGGAPVSLRPQAVPA